MLNINPEFENGLFMHSNRQEQGMGKIRPSFDYTIVALDGTGDFETIQEAIKSLPDSGGKIFIKEGTYMIDTAITFDKDNIYLEGAGDGTIIQTSGNITAINVGNYDAGAIKNLKITGSGAGNANYGISAASCGHLTIEECTITNCGAEAIYWTTVLYSTIKCCNIFSNKDIGIYAGGCSFGKIIFNRINANTGINIQLHNVVSDMEVIGNYIKDSGSYGLYITGTSRGVIVSNNCMTSNDDVGAKLSGCDNGMFTGNLFLTNTGNGMTIDAGSDDNIIVGNMFKNDALSDNGTDNEIGHNFE